MKFKHLAVTVIAALVSFVPVHNANAKDIVVTIKPLHSLVTGVVGNTAKTHLMVSGNQSPHGFKFKPSQVKLLNNSAVVFYIGDTFETFMEKAFDNIPSNVVKVPVAEKARLKLLPYREGGAWEEDKHEGHDHGHEGHHDESDGDMHVWLDPDNAIKMIKAITRELSKVYPENRDIYKANARSYVQKIIALDSELSAALSNSKEFPFIVFHDAYQYFEKHYGLNGVGSITFDPHDFPSPKRLKEIRGKLNEMSAACVFSEPQFSDRLVRTVIKGTSAKTALIDPLGSNIKAGPNLYFELLSEMAGSFKRCFNS
ncbi:MAG: zinc ABC transporter substrate-binding protein [Rhodospirillaceae bacterium]|nr:zinc ABC transporter substrate-binding protein [Rhodospirillaceae bacterium]OUU53928.1 MAG: hypothetical protein CBC15_16135 [Candidatus Endolissoclinum sp. TMED55]